MSLGVLLTRWSSTRAAMVVSIGRIPLASLMVDFS